LIIVNYLGVGHLNQPKAIKSKVPLDQAKRSV